MDAEHSGHPGGERFAHRADGAAEGRQVAADQGGQEAGGAEAAVRGADRADGRDIGGVVEEGAAAAVHLRVDEAGQQQPALQVMALRAGQPCIGGGHHIQDAAALEQHGVILDEAPAVQDAAIEQRAQHQTVSVTLLRCGGRSGSRPRARARALARR